MKKILIILTSFFFLTVLFLSCEITPEDDPLCGGGASEFEILSMGLNTIDSSGMLVNSDQFYWYNVVSKSIFISETRTLGQLPFEQERNGFIPSAYACSPIFIASQKVSSISIIAKNEFQFRVGEESAAIGAEINDYFRVASSFDGRIRSIENFIQAEGDIYLGEIVFELFLVERPFQPTTFIFDIIVTLDDGKVFTFEDEVLKIQ